MSERAAGEQWGAGAVRTVLHSIKMTYSKWISLSTYSDNLLESEYTPVTCAQMIPEGEHGHCNRANSRAKRRLFLRKIPRKSKSRCKNLIDLNERNQNICKTWEIAAGNRNDHAQKAKTTIWVLLSQRSTDIHRQKS
jgi:hypothetical protein